MNRGAIDLADSFPHIAAGLKSQYENAYINLSHLLLANGQALEACIALEEGTAHRPGNAQLHFNRAIACEDLGRLREAVDSCARALHIDPDLAEAHFNLARLH